MADGEAVRRAEAAGLCKVFRDGPADDEEPAATDATQPQDAQDQVPAGEDPVEPGDPDQGAASAEEHGDG